MQSTKPENPHLTDIFKTALGQGQTNEQALQPHIVVKGNNNIIAIGGGVIVHERWSRRRPSSPPRY